MNLTLEQQESVKAWAAEGASLSEIQTRLADEMGIRLSYMETRFLVIDIEAKLQDKPEPKPAEPKKPVRTVEIEDEAGGEDEATAAEPVMQEAPGTEADALGGAREVSVEISPLQRPGFALMGSVVFSDGVKAEWGFTNDGRFALDPEQEQYRPSAEDLRAFQMKLRELMTAQGY